MRRFIENIDDWNPANPLSVVGPTASGKTRAVLDQVTSRFGADLRTPLLVSVDAVAAYRGLDIGSAKVEGRERDDFDWRGLDLFDASERSTAADFCRQIEADLRAALEVRRPLVLVGGSHFYERALIDGRGEGEASNAEFQEGLESLPLSDLYPRLLALDPRWQQKAHANDRYRISRFLDLAERQALSFDQIFQAPKGLFSDHQVDTLVLGVDIDRDTYVSRLRSRIREMMARGWVAEVEVLLANYGAKAPALGTVGYLEIVDVLEGRTPKNEVEDLILTRHLQLVKKQKTWLRGLIRE